jgi:hypothetical protein
MARVVAAPHGSGDVIREEKISLSLGLLSFSLDRA